MSSGAVIFLLSFALSLSIVPFPESVSAYMPPWLLLVGLIFMYRLPLRFGVMGIFCFGLLEDLLGQHYIGLEALLYLMVGMMFRILMVYLINSSGLSRLLVTFALTVLYQLLEILMFVIFYGLDGYSLPLIPILVSSLLGVFMLLFFNLTTNRWR